jgi:hypothetical protein
MVMVLVFGVSIYGDGVGVQGIYGDGVVQGQYNKW